MKSKVEFSEKAEKFVKRKGVREVGGKSGYTVRTGQCKAKL